VLLRLYLCSFVDVDPLNEIALDPPNEIALDVGTGVGGTAFG